MGVISWLFYRDPERVIPKEAGLVLSPADGTVIYVRRLDAGEPLRCDKNGAAMVLDEVKGTGVEQEALWQVGISMVFTDVHVNRAPIAGKVSLVHHRPGKFLSLRLKEALNVNERQTLVITDGELQICLVQIASRLVRRIVSLRVCQSTGATRPAYRHDQVRLAGGSLRAGSRDCRDWRCPKDSV